MDTGGTPNISHKVIKNMYRQYTPKGDDNHIGVLRKINTEKKNPTETAIAVQNKVKMKQIYETTDIRSRK